jgi:hypothetical protein
MPSTQHALIVMPSDAHLANRLLSALILAWDDVPFATQCLLIRDAALMHNGNPNSTTMPAQLLAFIDTHKAGRNVLTSA